MYVNYCIQEVLFHTLISGLPFVPPLAIILCIPTAISKSTSLKPLGILLNSECTGKSIVSFIVMVKGHLPAMFLSQDSKKYSKA